MTDTPPEHRRSLDLVPRELERVLAKALAKEPEDRFGTAAEFHQALDDLSASLAARPRISWRVAAVAAAAVVALAAALVLILRR